MKFKKNTKKRKYKLFIFLKLIIIIFFYLHFNFSIDNNKKINNFVNINKIKNNKFNFYEINQSFINDNSNIKYYKILNFKYSFSLRFKKVKIEYNIYFFDQNKKIITPTNILYNDLQITCYFKVINDINLESISNIYQNKYFYCIEFFNIKERVKIGIKIYKQNNDIKKDYIIYFCNNKLFNYNDINNINDNIFDPLYINKQYLLYINKIKNNKYISKYIIKNYYNQYPICNLKKYIYLYYKKNINWIFINIYNHYFCFNIDDNFFRKNKNVQDCKYYFYISIIDNNRNIYNKTDYLFIDFIFANMPTDDTYPVFKEMIKQKLPAHYVTEKKSIYNEYCNNTKQCLTIIYVNRNIYNNYGDFLQKYLILFLKLKAVLSGKVNIYHHISFLFYKIEYINYISVGHGVCYFKYFLYSKKQIYGIYTNNKILLPNSYQIISIAKKYGWKDKDIIKLNLPRWDKYNKENIQNLYTNNKNQLQSNSIFILFTWRYINKNQTISSLYNDNIIKLLKNDNLYRELVKHKIILYFTLHRFIYYKYKNIYLSILKSKRNIKFINQGQISECLTKTNLVVSDFSSIVFDLMYRRKPIIIYIPDADEPNLKKIYNNQYYTLIQSMINGKIPFENKFLELNETINKIIYYINNNFRIEKKLKKFYDSFGFKVGNNINKFINYLQKLK